MQTLNALDSDNIRARAFNIRAHHVQKVRQIYNMRLLRRVFNRRRPLRKHRRQHNIHRRADTDNIEVHVPANQLIRFCINNPIRDACRRAERLKPLTMLVNRARP